MKSKIILLLLFVFSCSAFAVEVNDVNALTPATGIFNQDVKVFPKTVWGDAKKTYSNSDNLMFLLMAGGGSITMHYEADDKIANHFERHRSIPGNLDSITDWAGSPVTHFAATGVWYLMAANKKDDINIQRSWVMMRALMVTDATTLILKSTVQNHTPNNKNWAWPSGHTSSSFCFASVLDEFYGPKVGIPAYLAAGFVGYRMMDSGDHWASDVLFGSVLGYIVGHSIAGEYKLELAGFKILPYSTGTTAGITLAKEF